MAKTLPPLAWFRAFEAAARRLSFTAAAGEIGMTQSAVSQHVKALEGALGAPLFTRLPRGLALTDAGRKLLPQVAAALETLTNAARSFETGTQGELLTIAASVSVTQWLIAPHLPDFIAAHPTLGLRFVGTIWPDDFHSLRADVEIPFGSHRQFGKDAVLLAPNRLIAVKAPALEGSWADHPLIEAVGTSDGWASWQAPLGPSRAPQIFVDTFGAALNLVEEGNGIALVSEILVMQALAQGRLVQAHPHAPEGTEGYYLRVKPANPGAAAFGDWLLSRLGAG